MFSKKRSYNDVARGLIISEDGKKFVTKTLYEEFGIRATNYIIQDEGENYLSCFRCDAFQWSYIITALDYWGIEYSIIERSF